MVVCHLAALRQRRLACRLAVLLLTWFALYLSYYSIAVLHCRAGSSDRMMHQAAATFCAKCCMLRGCGRQNAPISLAARGTSVSNTLPPQDHNRPGLPASPCPSTHIGRHRDRQPLKSNPAQQRTHARTPACLPACTTLKNTHTHNITTLWCWGQTKMHQQHHTQPMPALLMHESPLTQHALTHHM